MSNSHSKEWYEQYAKEHGYVLTKFADRVIENVDKCLGYCPCRYAMYLKQNKSQEEMDKIKCPCVYIEEDMKDTKNHTCHCVLFQKTDM